MNSTINTTADHLRDLLLLHYLRALVLPIFILPWMILNFLLLLAICLGKKLPVMVRLILSNMVISSEVVLVGLAVGYTDDVLIFSVGYLAPSKQLCRATLTAVCIGSSARLLYMATYAVTVYVIARYTGRNLRAAKWKFCTLFLAIESLWLVLIVTNVLFFHPDIVHITFVDNTICIIQGSSQWSIVAFFMRVTLLALLPFIISTVFPVLTIVYIKKNVISTNKQTLKSMIKFSLFLLIVNGIHISGSGTFYSLITFSPETWESNRHMIAWSNVETFVIILSLIPSPFIVFVFFKPIRQDFKKIACFICWCYKNKLRNPPLL